MHDPVTFATDKSACLKKQYVHSSCWPWYTSSKDLMPLGWQQDLGGHNVANLNSAQGLLFDQNKEGKEDAEKTGLLVGY